MVKKYIVTLSGPIQCSYKLTAKCGRDAEEAALFLYNEKLRRSYKYSKVLLKWPVNIATEEVANA